MPSSGPSRRLSGIVAATMALVGLAVFAIRLQHAGPYAWPGGGNLRAGLLALAIAAALAAPAPGPGALARGLRWLAVAVSPVVLFFALYATLAELEEVVSLEATRRDGETVALRLWIVDRPDGAWATMPRSKLAEHDLASARTRLLRDGAWHCVTTEHVDDLAVANEIVDLRHEKYAVQRLATAVGLFGRHASANTAAIRIAPCDGAARGAPKA